MASALPETVSQPDKTPRQMIDVGYLLYFFLHIIGFLAVTLLISWGLFALFFLAIGNFSLDGLMHQLNNLASRYVDADAIRLERFKLIFGIAHLLLSAAVIFFRRHSILPACLPKGIPHHG